MNLSEEVKTILTKYQKDENEIEELLKRSKLSNQLNVDSVIQNKKRDYVTLEEAKKRNRAILKDLETVKGNLRSKAIYSPLEMQWEHISKSYCATPSLPVVSWRCHCSVYV